MEKNEFVKMMAYLAAGCGTEREISSATAQVYWDLLGDLPANVAKVACQRVLLNHRFPTLPPVGVIRQVAVEMMQPALKAWDQSLAEVEAAMSRYGYYRADEAMAALEAADPAVAAMVRRFGGFAALCQVDRDQWSVIRGQWRQAWEGRMAREREMAVLPANLRQLIGRTAEALGSNQS